MPRVTMQQIGEELGLSRATVSLAMRSDPSIPQTTRDKILECAKRLGYRPNPLVSALMADMRNLRGARTCTLAYLSHFTFEEMVQFPSAQRYFDGATARALEFGYKLDYFLCTDDPARQVHVGEVLLARGIPGVLISPAPRANYSLKLPWPHLCAATLGYTLKTPYLNRSINHQHHTLMLAVSKCMEYGYSKLALLLNKEDNPRVEYLFQGAFLSYQQSIPERKRVPMVFMDSMPEGGLRAWLKKYQPDVVIMTRALWIDEIRQASFDILPEPAIVILDHSKQNREFAGVDQRPDLVGAAGIDLVIQSLMTNTYGVPQFPKTVLSEGAWVDGPSLPPQRRLHATAAG